MIYFHWVSSNQNTQQTCFYFLPLQILCPQDLNVLISGDLTQETAILAKNLKITLIDLTHHESEVPGLYALENIMKELDINTEVIDKNPIEVIK